MDSEEKEELSNLCPIKSDEKESLKNLYDEYRLINKEKDESDTTKDNSYILSGASKKFNELLNKKVNSIKIKKEENRNKKEDDNTIIVNNITVINYSFKVNSLNSKKKKKKKKKEQNENKYIKLSPCTLDYRKKVLSSDEIFFQYENIKNIIYSGILENPKKTYRNIWYGEKLLSLDQDCMCSMKSGIGDLFSDDFACNGCNEIGRLTDREASLEEEFFKIKAGGMKKTKINIIKLRSYNDKIKLLKISNVTNIILRDISNDNIPEDVDINNIVLDDITHYILVGWILEEKLKSVFMTNYTRVFSGFICNDIGYAIREYEKYINFSEYIENKSEEDKILTLESVVKQIHYILYILSYYFFGLKNPTFSSINFTEDIYEIGEPKIICPLTIKLDYKESCISVKSKDRSILTNIFQRDNALDLILKNYIERDIITIEEKNGSTWYKFKNHTKIITFLHLRKISFKNFSSSFDFYSIIISLLTIPNTPNTPNMKSIFFDSPFLKKIWDLMWLDEDKKIIERRLNEQNKEITNVIDVSFILSGLNIRMSILEDIMEL